MNTLHMLAKPAPDAPFAAGWVPGSDPRVVAEHLVNVERLRLTLQPWVQARVGTLFELEPSPRGARFEAHPADLPFIVAAFRRRLCAPGGDSTVRRQVKLLEVAAMRALVAAIEATNENGPGAEDTAGRERKD